MMETQKAHANLHIFVGMTVKIKNIEATEEAKQKLLWERHGKNDGPSQFVSTNMAVNFVQHNRFNIDDGKVKNDSGRAEKINPKEDPKEKRKNSNEKATDDYHYERFKKQFRRF